jgi:hypothetical protein
MRRFKKWLRGLSSVQTGIFYLSIVLFFSLTFKHDPFDGYVLKRDIIQCGSINEVPAKYRNFAFEQGSFNWGEGPSVLVSYYVYGSSFDPRSYLSVGAMEKELRKNPEDRRKYIRTNDISSFPYISREPDHDLITSLSGYLILCGVLALMTSGAMWLVGIRESSPCP